MRISVIIATKDRAALLAQALQSLERQIGAPSFEVVVVDNGSRDDTRAVVQAQRARDRFPLTYVFEAQPNRGKARNRGVAQATGYLVAFCDDDVVLPPGWLAAHEAAHTGPNLVVSGPILNVASPHDRPRPTLANYSRAFLCTCNGSLPRHGFDAVEGFDEGFDLYGWEDTEFGVRLREHGLRSAFAWDAYLWHLKPPEEATLEVETRKAMERARMARRFLQKSPSLRVRLATGAHPLNLLRAQMLFPDTLLALYGGLATHERTPAALRAFARTQFLDGMYTRELLRSLRQ
ncbi:MAG: glycosyltransferase family 2 protein [Vulcanimicrobiaceae bacterium]